VAVIRPPPTWATRSRSSEAARTLKETARIASGGVPDAIWSVMAWRRRSVLPAPAPATMILLVAHLLMWGLKRRGCISQKRSAPRQPAHDFLCASPVDAETDKVTLVVIDGPGRVTGGGILLYFHDVPHGKSAARPGAGARSG